MKIRLNNKETEVTEGITVEALKTELGLPDKGVAVAVNDKIVLAGNQPSHIINEGDDIIIIGAAYGG